MHLKTLEIQDLQALEPMRARSDLEEMILNPLRTFWCILLAGETCLGLKTHIQSKFLFNYLPYCAHFATIFAHLMPTLCPPCLHLVHPITHLLPTFWPICSHLVLNLCLSYDLLCPPLSKFKLCFSYHWWFKYFFFREEILDFYKLKKNLDIEKFCKVYPESTMFCDLLMYAKGLKFEERPDYEKMRTQLNGLYLNLKK